ncbi:MAG: inorganic phosphate transporter [Candidatus Limnocylindrales bacterium]|nr:inorganic phosphate transporter [Candidatus Limnocylindrales bacterium]
MVDNTPLIVAAALFAVITGANDGASLIATNLSSKAMRPLVALGILVVAVVIGPFLLGTAVATTLARGLVGFDASGGEEALLLAVAIAIGVMIVLARLGLPSSVTQALTGAIIGIGIGRDLPVDAGVVGKVLLVLIVAPVAAGVLGLLFAVLLERLRPRAEVRGHLRRLHAVSFLCQCVAYAGNDGQKMMAIFAVASGAVSTKVEAVAPVQVAIGLLFFVGTLMGVSGLGNRVGKLLPIRPLNAISAGFGSSVAVLGSALLGSPVSMAQSSASALVGSETHLITYRRVRWEQAIRILSTWVTTLPTALGLAAIVGFVTRS